MNAIAETLSVENVVGSTGIDQELDLEMLSQDLEVTSYDPDQFPGLIYRTREPPATCLIFRSGKIVCTGADSIENVRNAVDVAFENFDSLGLKVPETPEITIQNLVSTGDMGQTLNLNAIAIGLGLEQIEYEPEQFPGLVYRPDGRDTVVLLFGSGRTVVTGAKNLEDVQETIEEVQTQLDELGVLE